MKYLRERKYKFLAVWKTPNIRSGVYTDSNCGVSNLGYHAMTIVGYGTLNGLNYWVNIYIYLFKFLNICNQPNNKVLK